MTDRMCLDKRQSFEKLSGRLIVTLSKEKSQLVLPFILVETVEESGSVSTGAPLITSWHPVQLGGSFGLT